MPDNRTHWDGCWRDPAHHACAVAEVERALANLGKRRVRHSFDPVRALLHRTYNAWCSNDHDPDLMDQVEAELRIHRDPPRLN